MNFRSKFTFGFTAVMALVLLSSVSNAQTDTTPPTVMATQLGNTSLTGNRTVFANALDDNGVASVTLFWSKNGGDFTAVPMTYDPTYQYYASIPGGVIGDVFRYYVEAKDTAVPANSASSPATGYYEYQITERPDYFTESFRSAQKPFDLAYTSITFTPDTSLSRYAVCKKYIDNYPTDPAGGTTIPMTDEGFVQVTLTDGKSVSIYGNSYNSFYIGSNGYITFDSGDTGYSGNLYDHFQKKRVSGLFTNLEPHSQGTVSWKQLSDRVAVTFHNVQTVTVASNNFQIEMFFDGRIVLSYLKIDVPLNVEYMIGLSDGVYPQDFQQSNMSEYPLCSPVMTQITDSIAPINDLNIPFGGVQIGSTRSENVTITNGGGGGLMITGIRLARYTEGFDNGTAPGWQEDVDASWTITNAGSYKATAPNSVSGHSMVAKYGGATFDNVYAETTFCFGELATTGPTAYLIIRATPDFDILPLKGSGYYFAIDQAGYYYLYKVLNGISMVLKSGTTTYCYPSPSWNTMAASFNLNSYIIYLNGQQVTSGTDSNTITSGLVGFGGLAMYSNRWSYYFDDMFVSWPNGYYTDGFQLTGLPTFPALLSAGESLNLGVNYTPLVPGSVNTTLRIDCKGANPPLIKLNLSGKPPSTPSAGSTKNLPNGSRVQLLGKRISAILGSKFYIQDEERSSGIGVYGNHASNYKPGDVVSVSGYMITQNEERLIQPDGSPGSVTITVSEPAPRPLEMTNVTLGGSRFGWPYYQSGVNGGKGLNNIGLLVKTTGVIKTLSTQFMTIDDGSGVYGGNGVMVATPYGISGYRVGDYVSVTGISSCVLTGPGSTERYLLARTSSDIRRLNP